MARFLPIALLALSLVGAREAHAQNPDWTPPTREMPSMPRIAELAGDWLSPRAAWFRGVEEISGVATAGLRADGEATSGGDYVQIVRFSQGPVPVVIWSDRNADARADMIEILRRGGVIIQLIDADYDGGANVIRVYDASGALVRERRM